MDGHGATAHYLPSGPAGTLRIREEAEPPPRTNGPYRPELYAFNTSVASAINSRGFGTDRTGSSGGGAGHSLRHRGDRAHSLRRGGHPRGHASSQNRTRRDQLGR